MEADRPMISAELEGLLREVAADPRAKLLAVPHAEALAGLLERASSASPSRAGLAVAERELLVVHRDELADVLRRACLTRFHNDPSIPVHANRFRTVDEEFDVDTPERWQARARDFLATHGQMGQGLDGIDLLETCVGSPRGPRPSITQIARASLRLAPSDVAEAYVGLDLALTGQPELGSRIMRQLLSRRPERVVASCIWENIAGASSQLGDDEGCVGPFEKALEIAPERPSAAIGWLVYAMKAGRMDAARRASRRLDELANDADTVVRELEKWYSRRFEELGFEPGKATIDVARAVADAGGAATRRICSVFL